jgi:hypothetical protein
MLMLLTVSSDPTDSVVDRVGVKGPLTFGGTKFGLVWTDSPSAMYRIQEYLPAGETLESFRQMLTIHVFDVEMETKAVVDQKVRELLARKKTDPFCNYMVTTSPDEKEYMVDFLLSDSKSEDADPTLLEFNVYRIKKIAYPDGKGAILVYAFTKRAYNDDILSFLDALKDERVEYLSEMIKTDLPTITR